MIPDEYNVDKEIYFQYHAELRDINMKVRKEFVKANIDPWESMTFILNEAWSFKVDFEYDINKEIGNFEREVIWAYEELGIIPEGEFSKSILEEYLEEKEK